LDTADPDAAALTITAGSSIEATAYSDTHPTPRAVNTNDPNKPSPRIRCNFLAMRGADVLFTRTVELADVPRIGERVHMWFDGAGNVRGTVRDVHWTIPQHGAAVANLQIQLSPADRRRFSRRAPIPVTESEAAAETTAMRRGGRAGTEAGDHGSVS